MFESGVIVDWSPLDGFLTLSSSNDVLGSPNCGPKRVLCSLDCGPREAVRSPTNGGALCSSALGWTTDDTFWFLVGGRASCCSLFPPEGCPNEEVRSPTFGPNEVVRSPTGGCSPNCDALPLNCDSKSGSVCPLI